MGFCDQYGVEAQLYFDNELRDPELHDFLVHLLRCATCQEYLEEGSELSKMLEQARPLYSASDELLQRVTDATATRGRFFSTSSLPDAPVTHWFQRVTQVIAPSVSNWRVATAVLLFIAVAITLVPTVIWHVGAASYADAALQTHRSYLAGNQPPEVVSSSPETVTKWFAGKLPFDFRLPASQPVSGGQQVYWLIGARLVKYKDNDAALVLYEMKSAKISLMVTSERSAAAAGGDQVQSGGLTFHYHTKDGMNIITWTTHGLTYALVSSIQGSVRSSCLVCHQNMADQGKFKDRLESGSKE